MYHILHMELTHTYFDFKSQYVNLEINFTVLIFFVIFVYNKYKILYL